MKKIETIMGMPVVVEIASRASVDGARHDFAKSDAKFNGEIFDEIFSYLRGVDEKFSTYKSTSEISAINRGELKEENFSTEMKEIFAKSEETKKLTDGYFDIYHDGKCDPSGIVKGWAIHNAAEILRKNNINNFYVEIAGDIEVSGKNSDGKDWSIGIRNPFKTDEIVKVVYLKDKGIATSGDYIKGAHIYNPKEQNIESDIISLTVIGPDAYEADRFATPAFAMGKKGIEFIEGLDGFEGYVIDKDGIATMTSGFEKYTKNYA